MSMDSRPVSRRGMKGSASSPVMDNGRPPSSMRPTTAKRPPSVLSQQRAPPTASRITTGLLLQKTQTGMSTAARPITQQGLSGLRTGTARAQQRQVLDKRYFEGLIRQKIKDITDEIHQLTNQIETRRQHEATTDVYEARVKEVATELTALQAELSDLNQVVDQVHTGTDISQIKDEIEEVHSDNAREASRLEQLFQRNYEMEQKIHLIEEEIQNEKNRAQKLLDDMEPEEREKYDELKELNENLLTEISEQQQLLDQLKPQAGALQDKIASSQLKQEALLLYQKLWEREERKAQLEDEARNKATPAQEREQLLQRVREDNAEMATMERQMAQITEQIQAQKQEVELVEQDLEESQSDRHQKLKELKRREEAMEQFLSTYEDNKTTEQNRMQILEGQIEIALQQMAKNTLGSGPLPSQDEFALMRETLEYKQDELEKSKMTAQELSVEEEKLQRNVKQVEDLHDKIINEINSIRDKMKQMEIDMKTYTDLDTLRDDAQSKRNELTEKRDGLLKRKVPTEKLQELQLQHEELQRRLNENDAYVQLHSLEKKLELLQQNNESLLGTIASRRSELDYQGMKSKALQLLNEFNNTLKKRTNKY